MQTIEERRVDPKLKDLVAEASRSLALLDANRLEELAVACQALNSRLAAGDREARDALASEAREASGDMAVFAKVLEATRVNLQVMHRMRQSRGGRLEYGEREARGWSHGNN